MKAMEADLWVAMIPYEETRIYVSRVMSNLARYSYLAGGESSVPEVRLTLPASAIETKEEASEY